MYLGKAKALDKVLLEFTGNVTIDWRKETEFKTKREYHLWENNINVLIGEGLLRKDTQTYKLCMTEKGFGVMTDLKNFGYTGKAKSLLFEKIKNIVLLIVSVSTFLILLFKLSSEDAKAVKEDKIILEDTLNTKPIKENVVLVKPENNHKSFDSLKTKSDTSKLIQKKLKLK